MITVAGTGAGLNNPPSSLPPTLEYTSTPIYKLYRYIQAATLGS